MRLVIHFIDEDINEIILRRTLPVAPLVGDEIRFGGVDNEKFYKVTRLVWVYDEEVVGRDGLRVNIGVVDTTDMVVCDDI